VLKKSEFNKGGSGMLIINVSDGGHFGNVSDGGHFGNAPHLLPLSPFGLANRTCHLSVLSLPFHSILPIKQLKTNNILKRISNL
jgi:hypothetical protein